MSDPTLLGLPYELRLQIYNHFLPIDLKTGPTCTGLRLTCHQLQQEFDHEALRLVNRLNGKFARIPGLSFAPVASFADISTLTIQVDKSVFFDPYIFQTERSPAKHIPWRTNRLTRIVLRPHDDGSGRRVIAATLNLACWRISREIGPAVEKSDRSLFWEEMPDDPTAIREVVFDWSLCSMEDEPRPRQRASRRYYDVRYRVSCVCDFDLDDEHMERYVGVRWEMPRAFTLSEVPKFALVMGCFLVVECLFAYILVCVGLFGVAVMQSR